MQEAKRQAQAAAGALEDVKASMATTLREVRQERAKSELNSPTDAVTALSSRLDKLTEQNEWQATHLAALQATVDKQQAEADAFRLQLAEHIEGTEAYRSSAKVRRLCSCSHREPFATMQLSIPQGRVCP